MSVRFSFDERAFNREVKKTMQYALEQKAQEIGTAVQGMLDGVFRSHQHQDADTIERELVRQYRSVVGQEATPGSLRESAESIARGERPTVETNLVWE